MLFHLYSRQLNNHVQYLCGMVGRNVFSYGRNESNGNGGVPGTARPEVLDKLLASTERVVQEIDSVGLLFNLLFIFK